MDRAKTEHVEGSNFLLLDIGKAPEGQRAAWLAEQLRTAIQTGRLPLGTRLPPSRVLAAELGVSRGVVTEAYQRLGESGQVDGQGRRGTVVVGAPLLASDRRVLGRHSVPPRSTDGGTTEVPSLFASPTTSTIDQFRAATVAIDLSPGVPDLAAFPRAAWLKAERAALQALSPADFGYGDPRGAPVFRSQVAHWLARNRGIAVDPGEVIIVSGVAQALALLARVLRGRGLTTIAVEDPGSLGARQQLNSWEMRTEPVEVDALGLRVDRLRDCEAAAVLVTPAHQFPTGVVLDGGRRRELLAWAADGGLIIEDDYDAEHRYDRPPVTALRAGAPETVVYAGSVSKLLAPALRVGWLLVPERLRDEVVAAKRDADLGNAVLPQLVLAHLMASGELERQLRFARSRHRRRRDAMVAALAEHLPDATVHGAAAGLHLVITFDEAIDDVALAAAALDRGVKLQPLSWHSQTGRHTGLVLGYAANPPGLLADGIRLLGQARRVLAD